MTKAKERANKLLFSVEIVLIMFWAAIVFTLIFVKVEKWIKILSIFCGLLLFFIGLFCALKIEQIAGYYECTIYRHRYVLRQKMCCAQYILIELGI